MWIVFIITGLWHGASWNFVAWGIFHGFFIFIEKMEFKKILDKFHIINHLYTLLIVNFGFVLFRSNNIRIALIYLKKMIIPTGSIHTISKVYSLINIRIILISIIAILLCGVIQSIIKYINKKIINKIIFIGEPIFITCLWIICIMSLVSNTYNPFIYFKF